MDANQFPSREHPFGTDTIGHDYAQPGDLRHPDLVHRRFRRRLLIACLIGLPLGLAAGLRGGWPDFIVLRIVEIMTAFPGILFAIFLISVVNSGAVQAVLSAIRSSMSSS